MNTPLSLRLLFVCCVSLITSCCHLLADEPLFLTEGKVVIRGQANTDRSHLAFTDVASFRGKLYLAYRAAKSHEPPDRDHGGQVTTDWGRAGSIEILRSKNGYSWDLTDTLIPDIPGPRGGDTDEQYDFRDPVLLVIPALESDAERLILIATDSHTASSRVFEDQGARVPLIWWTDDGDNWNGPIEILSDELDVGDPTAGEYDHHRVWPVDLTIYQDQLYLLGYRRAPLIDSIRSYSPRLYRMSVDRISELLSGAEGSFFDTAGGVLSPPSGTNASEGELRIRGGKAYVVFRNHADGGATPANFIVGSAPVDNGTPPADWGWDWQVVVGEDNTLSGPGLTILPDGRLLASGRRKRSPLSEMVLHLIEEEDGVPVPFEVRSIKRLGTFSSPTNTGYGGFTWHEGAIYHSYFGGGGADADIYMSKAWLGRPTIIEDRFDRSAGSSLGRSSTNGYCYQERRTTGQISEVADLRGVDFEDVRLRIKGGGGLLGDPHFSQGQVIPLGYSNKDPVVSIRAEFENFKYDLSSSESTIVDPSEATVLQDWFCSSFIGVFLRKPEPAANIGTSEGQIFVEMGSNGYVRSGVVRQGSIDVVYEGNPFFDTEPSVENLRRYGGPGALPRILGDLPFDSNQNGRLDLGERIEIDVLLNGTQMTLRVNGVNIKAVDIFEDGAETAFGNENLIGFYKSRHGDPFSSGVRITSDILVHNYGLSAPGDVTRADTFSRNLVDDNVFRNITELQPNGTNFDLVYEERNTHGLPRDTASIVSSALELHGNLTDRFQGIPGYTQGQVVVASGYSSPNPVLTARVGFLNRFHQRVGEEQEVVTPFAVFLRKPSPDARIGTESGVGEVWVELGANGFIAVKETAIVDGVPIILTHFQDNPFVENTSHPKTLGNLPITLMGKPFDQNENGLLDYPSELVDLRIQCVGGLLEVGVNGVLVALVELVGDGTKSSQNLISFSKNRGRQVTSGSFYTSTIYVDSFSVGNAAPVVNAGVDVSTRIVSTPATVLLEGSVVDVTILGGHALTYSWSQVYGPSQVTFSDESALSSSVTIPEEGIYTFRLTATDGLLTSSDEVTVIVAVNSLIKPELVLSMAEQDVILSWSPVLGATEYQILSSTALDLPIDQWETLFSVSVADSEGSFTHKGAMAIDEGRFYLLSVER